MPANEIGTGLLDRLTKIGSVVTAPSSTSARFKITSLAAQKSIMLRLTGAVDITTQATSIPAYGPLNFLKGIRTLVSGQPGPYTLNGQMLYLKNLADHKRAPYLAVPAAITVADDVGFEAVLCLDFAFPNFEDEDASLLKTKVDKTYELEFDFGSIADLVTGGAAHLATAGNPVLDIYSQEIPGLAATKNIYNKNYQRTINLAVNSQLRIPLDLSAGFLNMLFLVAKDTNGALSDTVITNVSLRNGSEFIFRDLEWKALKRWTELKTPIVSPAILPAGFNWIDLTTNNVWKSMVNAARNKELELILNCAAVGTLDVGLNLATEPVPGD
jgi:hypothetical protein